MSAEPPVQQVAVVPEEPPSEPTVQVVEETAMVVPEVEEVKVEDIAPPNAPVNNSGNLLQPESESE